MNLRGCLSLVTGGGRRLGAGVSKQLAASGSDIAIHYRQSRQEAEATASELAESGVRTSCFQADLSEATEIEKLLTEVEREFGRLDVLVNSAANFDNECLEEIGVDQWDLVHSVNLRAPFLCTKFGARLIRESERQDQAPGLIVNIADLSGVLAWPGFSHHGASKAGLLHLTKVSARELAPSIRVNAVVPGAVLPPADATADSRKWQELIQTVPLGRAGNPTHIGDTVVFLAQNDFVLGETIFVDGGEHLLGACHRQ